MINKLLKDLGEGVPTKDDIDVVMKLLAVTPNDDNTGCPISSFLGEIIINDPTLGSYQIKIVKLFCKIFVTSDSSRFTYGNMLEYAQLNNLEKRIKVIKLHQDMVSLVENQFVKREFIEHARVFVNLLPQ